MQARLFSRTGKTRGSETGLDAEATIGRDKQSTLVIDLPLMSSQHARIFFDQEDGRYVLEDLGSLNGTELDGDRVIGPERLGHLHVITFAGSYDFFFQDLERCAQRHLDVGPPPGGRERPASTEPVARKPAASTESQEVTAVESEPVAMPDFLARRADALGEEDSERPTPPRDITAIESEPVALPGSLARHADKARADAARGEKAEDEGGAEPPSDQTIHEKLPVAMPDFLARRADEAANAVQQHETVDLADIEELISADSEIVQDAAKDDTLDLGLVVTESGGGVRRFPLAAGENLIGRGTRAQVALHYPDLSRRHAVFTVAGDEIRLRDLGSRNRTFVDDAPLEPEVEVTVEPGARIRFGSVEARLIKIGEDDK